MEEIQATRSTNEPMSRLEIRLKLSDMEIEWCAAVHCRVTKAADDTGANLLSTGEDSPALGDLGMFGQMVRLKLPDRKALVLEELSGVIEMIRPDRDPEATVKVAGFVGNPRVVVSHPTLNANGIALAVVSKAEFDRMQGLVQTDAHEKPRPGAGRRGGPRTGGSGSSLVALRRSASPWTITASCSSKTTLIGGSQPSSSSTAPAIKFPKASR